MQHGLPARPLRRHRQSTRDVTVATPDWSRSQQFGLRLGLVSRVRSSSSSRSQEQTFGISLKAKCVGMAFDLQAKVSRSRPVLKPRYRSGISATDLTVRLRLSLPLEGVVLFDITGSYETCAGSTCSEICRAQLRPGKATSSSSSAHQ